MPIHLYIDVPEPNYYYSEANFQEYQDLVTDIWSINFVDSWSRFRFNYGVYIWNRTALDFQQNSNTMRTINLDNLTSTSKTLSVTMPNNWLRIRYFWNNRILTPSWILDFQWNVISSFSYTSVVPWEPWVVWANSWYDIYKGVVDWDNITFTKIWTSWTDQGSWYMYYWHLGAYLTNGNDTQWSWYSAYVNPSTNAISNFTWWSKSRRSNDSFAGPDWKLYRWAFRYNWWWRFQKIWTWDEWFVGNSNSTSWSAYWDRYVHFLWNFVSWWMNSSNGTWSGYGSNNYYIDTSWNMTLLTQEATPYDTSIHWDVWFIDEKWYIYPLTSWWWSGVILKTNKTFTDLPWRNPYLFR